MATHPINDYYVVTSRRGEYPDRWSWEIRRKSRPLGIKMTGDGFQSKRPAICRQECAGGISGRLNERRKAPPQVRPPWCCPSRLRFNFDLGTHENGPSTGEE